MKGQMGKDEPLFRGSALAVLLVDPTEAAGTDVSASQEFRGPCALGSHHYAFERTEHRGHSRALAGTDT